MTKMNLKQIIFESFIAESQYAFLGGRSKRRKWYFTDEEMRRNVVDRVLGKNYDAYIMFDETGEYEKIKNMYAKDADNWEVIWRSESNESNARLSPNKKVIDASIFDRGKGGIIGAIYIKK